MSFYETAALATWLGIVTSISPCPLTANITAVSFLSRNVTRTQLVLLNGFLYTLGRSLAYLVVAFIIAFSAITIPSVSYFLQNYFNKIVGPVLILVGMVLLNMITIRFSGFKHADSVKNIVDKNKTVGAFFMGLFFALSFCPVSAALFFGSLIPLSVKSQSGILVPSLYGVGTAIPVLVFVVLVAAGSRLIGKVFKMLTVIEIWARKITGVILIVAGILYCLNYIFAINISLNSIL